MSNRSLLRFVLCTLGGAAVVVSCSDPETKVPSTPSGPAFVAAEIVAPASIAPGASVQLTASARFSDGSLKAVAGTSVIWSSGNVQVLTMTPGGMATASQTRGDAQVIASVTINGVRRNVSRTIMVMPDGTFRVVGNVREADAPNPAIAGARVEVSSGDPVTFTDTFGAYRLYGVPPGADIRVTATGYATDTRTVALSSNSTQDFRLNVDGPRLTFSGDYTMSIDVMDGCPGIGLPASLQHRSYDATVTQSGAIVDVLLTEPRFRLNPINRGNKFRGNALAGAATFRMDFFDAYYYPFYGQEAYPNIAEIVGDGTYLVTNGTVNLAGTASSASGLLSGSMLQWDSRFPSSSARVIASCSGAIQISLTHK